MIEGRYGVRLRPGDEYATTSISQVGLIPNHARSLYFKSNVPNFSQFRISLNGVEVPYVYVLGPGDNSIFGANIEPFAGLEVELRFTGYMSPDGFSGGATIDSLTFSPSTVPEPSTWMLLGAGTLALLGWFRVRRSEEPVSTPGGLTHPRVQTAVGAPKTRPDERFQRRLMSRGDSPSTRDSRRKSSSRGRGAG